jgi:hypothetical protein
MCFVALPVAAAAATAIGGGIKAFGQVQAGRQNDAIAKANANSLEMSAKDAEARARLDGEILRQQIAERVGQQRAGFAAANVDISRGSAANLSIDTAGIGELELNRTLNNAAREAYGMRTQAAITRAEGKNAKAMGYLGAGATLLTTASDTFGSYKMMKGR